MFFYKVKDNKLVFPRVMKKDLEVGEIYNVNFLVEHGEFGGQKQAYFYEYSVPYQESMIMTDPNGEKAFAVATNDSIRDNFPQFCLAKILVQKDNYIVYAYSESAHSDEIHIVIMKVVDVFPTVSLVSNEDAINVRVEGKFVVGENVDVGKLKKAVDHVIMVMRRNLGDYLTPKYSFNSGRMITTRLFHRNENDDIISYLETGQKLILNKNSLEKYKQGENGPLIDNAVIRCFYSKKHKDKDVIIVEGCKVNLLWENDLELYINESNITREMASNMIKKVYTTNGNYFFAVINIKGELRPIYHTSAGFATFALNEYEFDFIREVQDLSF